MTILELLAGLVSIFSCTITADSETETFLMHVEHMLTVDGGCVLVRLLLLLLHHRHVVRMHSCLDMVCLLKHCLGMHCLGIHGLSMHGLVMHGLGVHERHS